ncbi:MAG: protein kinase [Fuerstiella sp.]
MSKKNPSENETPRQSPVYGTQIPAFGKDQPESAPAAGEAEREPDAGSKLRPAFGTQMAPPIAEAVGQPQLQRDLPPEESPRHVSRTYQAGDVQLTQVLQDARAEVRTVSLEDAENFAVAAADAPDSAESGRESQPRRSTRNVAGKSTWNLRIRERGVAGHIAGVVNEIPADPSTATGLQSALAVDDSVPEYEVIGELGAGNMGIVYRARQTSLNRELAIKTLKPDTLNVDHNQAMFVSEAVVTANLVHPNIVPIHDLGRTEDGKLFYSMKQVTGTPWNTTVRELSLEDNVEILMKVSDAVAFAHSQGVINRDLKPENVIVGDYGEVIVLDWGLAITTDEFSGKDSVVVDFRGGAGTPVYMPPELADEDVSRVGRHSDIYLLGAMLYEALEGFPPHLLRESWGLDDPQEQLNAVIRAVLNNEIEPNVMNEGELMEIARTAMSTDPQDRYSSVEQFQDAIREYRITGRAEELMHKVELKGTTSYSEYQSAVALYAEALRKWPNNRRAIDGDQKARQAYAELAHTKGDIDLGLQVIPDEADRRFNAVRSKLKKTRRVRTIVRRTWSLLFVSMVALVAITLLREQEILHIRDLRAASEEETVKQQALAATAQTEAATAKTEAATAQTEAATAKTEAATAGKLADEKIDEANEAIAQATVANAEKKLAKDQLENAEAQLMNAKTELVGAETKREEVLKDAAETYRKAKAAKFEGATDLMHAKMDVGKYDEVVTLVDRVLTEFEWITPDDEKLLRSIKEEAQRLSGNMAHQGEVDTAVVSSDGTTLLTVSNGLSRLDGDELTVYRNPGTFLEDHEDDYRLKLGGRSTYDLAVSDGGTVVCSVGRGFRHAHAWDGNTYSELELPAAPGMEFRQCLVSRDGRHIYFVGSDRHITIDVLEVDAGKAKLNARHQLDEEGGQLNNVLDVVLLPDESAIVVAAKPGGCRSVSVDWSMGKVQIAQCRRQDALDNVFPQLKGLKNLGGGERERFEPQRIALSHDGSMLALIHARRVIILPRNVDAPEKQFPFVNPERIKGFQVLETSLMKNITTAVFSMDNLRLVTVAERYLQVWESQGSNFGLCEIEGLYSGKALAGHNTYVRTVGFLNASNSRLVSVSHDNVVRTWNTRTYAEYVAQLWKLVETLKQKGKPNIPLSQAGDPVHTPTLVAEQDSSWPESRGATNTQRKSNRHSAIENARPAETPRRTGFSVAEELPSRQYILTGGPQPSARPKRNRQARRIFSAEFSGDSERLVLGADDIAAHSFEALTANRVASMSMQNPRDPFFAPERNNFLEGHISEIVSLRFLPPAGDLLITLDYFGSISVWDAKNDDDGIGHEKSRPLPILPLLSVDPGEPYEVEDPSCEIAVSSDGKWILAGGVRNDGNVDLKQSTDKYFAAIWRTEDVLKTATPAPYRVLENEHPFRITAAAFSPDGRLAVTAGRRGHFVLWNFEDNAIVATTAIPGHGTDGVSGIFFLSNSEFISAGFDGRVFRWTQEGKDLVAEEIARGGDRQIPDFIIRLRASPDGTQFITSDLTKDPDERSYHVDLNVWSSKNGWQSTLPVSIKAPSNDLEKSYRHDLSWSSDGSEVLYIHDEQLLTLETTNWKVISGFRFPKGIRAIRGACAPSADGTQQVATFDGRFAQLWNAETGEHIVEFRSHGPFVRASFSSDRRFLVTGSETIRVFDSDESSPDHGRPIFRLSRQVAGNAVFADVRFSPARDDYRFASVDVNGVVKVWDWEPKGLLPGKAAFESDKPADKTSGDPLPNAICWSDDGKMLAAIQAGQIRLWNIQQGQMIALEVKLPEDILSEELVLNDIDIAEGSSRVTAAGTYEGESFGLVWKISGNVADPVAIIDAKNRHSSAEQSQARMRGITVVAFDQSSNEIITGGADSKVVRWQVRASDTDEVVELRYIADKLGAPGDGFDVPHTRSISAIDVAPNGSIVTADDDGYFVVWPPRE